MLDDNRYLELIGLKVKLLRQRKRMSQQELADKVGYTNKGMISQVESGKVNITMDKLSKMAKALDIPIYELMKEDLSFLEGKGRPEGAIAFSPDPLAGLEPDDIKRVVEYINLLKGAKAWQNQNGTEKDGDTASPSTDEQDHIPLRIQDEKAEQK